MVGIAILILGAQWWIARRGDDPFAGGRPPTAEEARERGENLLRSGQTDLEVRARAGEVLRL